MKKRIYLLTGLAILSLGTFSQEVFESDYYKFRSFFKQAEIDSKEKKIPIELASNVLGDKIVNENVVNIYTFDFISVDNNETYIIEVGRPQGGFTNTFYMVSFCNEMLIETEIIGFNALNNEGGTRCELNMINDTLIEVKSEEVEYNESEEEKKVSDTEYNYYGVNKHGFYKVTKGDITGSRLYPEASYKILEISELKNLEKEDLDIMRNEIFAGHGYIFKTEKWNKYFTNQDWYNPRYENVTEKLTIIEKINIERILEVAPLK
jgi:hypothetical protein